jgi:hypothetical protein
VYGNQSFLSHNNTILTLQGHPEKDAQCAMLRLRDVTRWFGVEDGNQTALDRFKRAMERHHHGPEVWEKVLDWARDKRPKSGIQP